MKHDTAEMKDYAEDIDALLVFVRPPTSTLSDALNAPTVFSRPAYFLPY